MAVLTVSVLGVTFPYITQFAKSSLSDKPEHWGQVGDYFGGLLNPIISLINLVVTLFIAFEIHKLNIEQGHQQAITQKIILRVQLQYDLLKQYDQEISSRISKIESRLNEGSFDQVFFNRQHEDLQNALSNFANTSTSISWTVRANELWITFREAVTEWKKSHSKGSHIDKIRTYKSLLFSELYSELLS